MKLTCSSCQTAYRIADERVPAKGARANCPNCGQVILIPGSDSRDLSPGTLNGGSGTDYGQTMAYDFQQVDQSRSEISSLLQKISGSDPFIREGLTLSLRDVREGGEYPLPKAEVTVGRSGSDITVDDPEVSRRHCLVKAFGDRIVIIDLESTNGTYVQGRKIMTAALGALEEFTIGSTTFALVTKRVD